MMWLLALALAGIGLWNLFVGLWIMAAILGLFAFFAVYVAIEQMLHDDW